MQRPASTDILSDQVEGCEVKVRWMEMEEEELNDRTLERFKSSAKVTRSDESTRARHQVARALSSSINFCEAKQHTVHNPPKADITVTNVTLLLVRR
jgi:hypothetical protein